MYQSINTCMNVRQTLHVLLALARIVNHLRFGKSGYFMKTFILYLINCCHFVAMFHSRKHSHVNGIHEKAHGLTYSDKRSTFNEFIKWTILKHSTNGIAVTSHLFLKLKNYVAIPIMK